MNANPQNLRQKAPLAFSARHHAPSAKQAQGAKYAVFSFELPQPRPARKRTIRILAAEIDNADNLATQERVSSGATYVSFRRVKPKECYEWWGNLKWGDCAESVQKVSAEHDKTVTLA